MSTVVRLGGTAPGVNRAATGTDLQRLGGEAGLRPIIDDFLSEVFADPMIGFLFQGKNHARIRAMELSFASAHLGGTEPYDGRSMREVHARSPISSGHFARRREILRQTLVRHEAPEDLIARWMAHLDGLRDQVMGGHTDACGDNAPLGGK